MEESSRGGLPPVFKMSLLSKILPYFGYLHQWRRLLTEINKETEEIWEENQEIFVYTGRDYKEERSFQSDLKYYGEIRRSIIELFQITEKWCTLSLLKYFKSLLRLCEKLNEDELVVLDLHRKKTGYFQILFSNKDHLSDILPAVSCPSINIEKNTFENFNNFTYNINKINYSWNKAIVIEKQWKLFTMYSVFSPNLRLISGSDWNSSTKNLIDDMYNQCQHENWSWRPTILEVDSSCTNEEYECISSLQWIEKINEAKIDIYLCDRSTKIVLNSLLTKFPDGKYNFKIYRYISSYINYLFSGKLWTLVLNEDIVTIKWNSLSKNNEYLLIRGREMIESDWKSLVALNLWYLDLKDLQFEKIIHHWPLINLQIV